MEPADYGQPIVAIAAETEQAAADAIAASASRWSFFRSWSIRWKASSPTATMRERRQRRPVGGIDLQTLKWSGKDFAPPATRSCPGAGRSWNGPSATSKRDSRRRKWWSRKLCHTPRTRTTRWSPIGHSLLGRRQVPLLGLHPVDSRSRSHALRGPVGIRTEDLVFVAEFCGGGFGARGQQSVYGPARDPVEEAWWTSLLMRVSRQEEHNNGMRALGFQGWARLGFR